LSFFNKHTKETFFIPKNFDKQITSKCNLILSPEFYWAKRVTLKISFAYEVKKLAPSLFDGVLPSGDFKYSAFKLSKDDYIVIAYDMTSIKKTLRQLNIDVDLIEKIYLAQSEFLGKEISLRVNETCGMTSLDGVLVYTCLNFIDTNTYVDDVIKSKKLTNNQIYSKQYQKLNIQPKQLTVLIWIAFLLNAIVVLDTIKIEKIKSKLISQKEDFMEKNALPKTSFQLKSIQDELQIIDTSQSDLRNSINYINQFKLNKTESFKKVSFSKNKLEYSIKLDNDKRKNEFKAYLSKKENSTIIIGTNL